MLDLSDRSHPIKIEMTGLIAESVEWSRDGSCLLVLAAEEGAEQAAVNGSGRLAEANGDSANWMPTVRRGGTAGWRRAFAVDWPAGTVRSVSPRGVNVWEACLAGEAVLAVVSRAPGEGAWADSTLELMALDGTWQRLLHQPRRQLAWPAASPDATRLAIVEGVASDRGLVAGDIVLFDRAGGDGAQV